MASSASTGRPAACPTPWRRCSAPSMAWRTAWIPPRSSCSATGICSGRKRGQHGVAVHGRGGRGRALAPGRPASPRRDAGRRDGAARRRRAPAGHRRRPSRRRRRSTGRRRGAAAPLPALAVVVARGASAEPGAEDHRDVRCPPGRPLDLDADPRPSRASAPAWPRSARGSRSLRGPPRRRPAARPRPPRRPAPGHRRPSLGLPGPAARQVHEPSARLLVNSMSMRRDMRRTRYLAGAGPDAGPDRHPVTSGPTSADAEPPGRAATHGGRRLAVPV